MKLRWGIVSAGLISNDFVTALTLLPPETHVTVAVAARDLSRAKKFAEEHNIEKCYDSYEKLAKDSDIGMLLIGLLFSTIFQL